MIQSEVLALVPLLAFAILCNVNAWYFRRQAYNKLSCQSLGGSCMPFWVCRGTVTSRGSCLTYKSYYKCCIPSSRTNAAQQRQRYNQKAEPCWSRGGNCLPGSKCLSRSRLYGACGSQESKNIRCCIPYQESSCPGKCQRSDKSCQGGSYYKRLCKTQPDNVKCCVKTKTGTGGSSLCGENVKTLACQLKNHQNINFLTIQVKGVSDGADARSNILDTCNGNQAKRSNYENAIGGSVCLKTSMLKALKEVADSYSIQVNSLAGGSHSENSKHYDGLAFDLQARNKNWQPWVNICEDNGATKAYHPGDPGHSGHVHCEFA